jgi:hypothetical protein
LVNVALYFQSRYFNQPMASSVSVPICDPVGKA